MQVPLRAYFAVLLPVVRSCARLGGGVNILITPGYTITVTAVTVARLSLDLAIHLARALLCLATIYILSVDNRFNEDRH